MELLFCVFLVNGVFRYHGKHHEKMGAILLLAYGVIFIELSEKSSVLFIAQFEDEAHSFQHFPDCQEIYDRDYI